MSLNYGYFDWLSQSSILKISTTAVFDIITFPPGRDDHDDDDDDDYDDGITVSLYLNHIQQQHLPDSACQYVLGFEVLA